LPDCRQAGALRFTLINMLNLTKQEKNVILFLLVIALAGCGINYLVKKNEQLKSVFCLDPDFGKLNINKADNETLKEIPGIGEKLAQRIIDYRRQNGSFSSIEELKNVKGLKASKFEKIKDAAVAK
jgi:comEA protein